MKTMSKWVIECASDPAQSRTTSGPALLQCSLEPFAIKDNFNYL